jgi:hypothetical protein
MLLVHDCVLTPPPTLLPLSPFTVCTDAVTPEELKGPGCWRLYSPRGAAGSVIDLVSSPPCAASPTSPALLHTSAYVSIRQHTSAYVALRCLSYISRSVATKKKIGLAVAPLPAACCLLPAGSAALNRALSATAYVIIREHTSAPCGCSAAGCLPSEPPSTDICSRMLTYADLC